MFAPVAPPAPVPIYSGFDYVKVDAQRRRVYAAHEGSQALLIVDADNGKGPWPSQGRSDGTALRSILSPATCSPATARIAALAEVDPVAMKVMRVGRCGRLSRCDRVRPGRMHRIYADEDDGTHLYVIDTTSMKLVSRHPASRVTSRSIWRSTRTRTRSIRTSTTSIEIVVIDPTSLKVVQSIPTPGIEHNHPLQLDPGLGHLYVSGRGGLMLTYDLSGKLLWTTKYDGYFDQCDLDPARHNLACGGNGGVTIFHDSGSDVSVLGVQPIAKGVRTVGMDSQTGNFWAVWASPSGDFVQGFKVTP